MKSPITIDFVNSIIIVNAAYAKKASNPFSQEYEQLQRVRADYPTYAVITRTIKKNSEKESYKGLTYHSIAKEGLERAVTNSKTTVIALTATPEIVKKEFNTAIYELPVSEDVRHYETTEVVRYTNLNALLSSINAIDKIGICYVTRITAMKELNALAVKLGYFPICIWSTSNQDHPMTDEQHTVREQILKNFIIPEKYNLLIINASCATSILIDSDSETIGIFIVFIIFCFFCFVFFSFF